MAIILQYCISLGDRCRLKENTLEFIPQFAPVEQALDKFKLQPQI
jgi:hypothetical protein